MKLWTLIKNIESTHKFIYNILFTFLMDHGRAPNGIGHLMILQLDQWRTQVTTWLTGGGMWAWWHVRDPGRQHLGWIVAHLPTDASKSRFVQMLLLNIRSFKHFCGFWDRSNDVILLKVTLLCMKPLLGKAILTGIPHFLWRHLTKIGQVLIFLTSSVIGWNLESTDVIGGPFLWDIWTSRTKSCITSWQQEIANIDCNGNPKYRSCPTGDKQQTSGKPGEFF